MSILMYVQATTGLKVPKEGNPRVYITGTDIEPVKASHYYRKAISDGDLVERTEKEFTEARAKAEEAAAAAAVAAEQQLAAEQKAIAAAERAAKKSAG
ncbi:hypothetical protein [Herminiimonas arsenitoxidans]|uniref:hypothetical protein n=1 Tax=Herminiimonas arsenitoxidans TaxID=1809410 RepID=UPI0012FFC406|nr:hypothetical protein [Herminiimonas arsenitoxidans]